MSQPQPLPDLHSLVNPGGRVLTRQDLVRPTTAYDVLGGAAQRLANADEFHTAYPDADPTLSHQLLDVIEARAAAIRAQFPLEPER